MATNQKSTEDQGHYVVAGTISDAAGQGLPGLEVRVLHRQLRSESELGRAVTDAEGQYRVEYRLSEPRRASGDRPDLVVKVFRGKEADPILISRVIFNASKTEQVDLSLAAAVDTPRPEYEQLMEAVVPALAGVDPADLTDDDLEFLAGDTGAPRHRIALLRRAARMAAQTAIPIEVFYALARQGIAVDDPAHLLQQPLPSLRRALDSAVTEGVLPEHFRDRLDGVMKQLRSRALDEVLRPDVQPGHIPVGALLGTSRLSPAAKERLVATALESDEAMPNFWQRLAETPEFADAEQMDEARITLQLGVLTGYHLPLVQSIQAMRADGRLSGLEDLASWDEQQWVDLVRETGASEHVPGEAEETRAENYAASLFRQVEAAFPTAAIAAQLARSALPQREEISSFFAAHPDFDLLTDSVERRFGAELAPSVCEGVKRIQRLARVTPRFRQIETLLNAGFTSAQQIGAMSEGAFTARVGNALGGSQLSRAVYRKAAQRKDLALNLRTRYAAEQDPYRPRVIPPASPDIMMSAASDDPTWIPGSPQIPDGGGTPTSPSAPEQPIDWTALFGSPDVCACAHCRSVLSPAAYFVDLLQFLKNESNQGLTTLFDPHRRPDLQHILLNCDNTDTPLPYIDLVNEVLERAVAGHPLVQESYQTTWAEEELAANPEHIAKPAYVRLREAIFPLSLPLDLDAEEARVYLGHLGTSRHELMEAFYPGSDPLDDPDIAAEYLGLTKREWHLIQGDDGSSPWALWGLAESDWLDVLTRPQELMRRADIDFTELQELLSLGFVNTWNRLALSFGVSSATLYPANQGQEDTSADCRLESARINVQDDPQALSRLCRFVRLWRKLDWSMRDLDTALFAFGARGADNHIPLMAVSHLRRLHERLRLPIPDLAVLFGPISTRPMGVDEPSQYERLFLAKSVVHPNLDDQRKAFKLDNLGRGGDLHAQLPYVAAALGTPAEQLLILADWLDEMRTRRNASPLSVDLASLSMLYRLTLLARSLGLGPHELAALIELHGVGPGAVDNSDALAAFSPREVFALLDSADRLRASGFGVTELDYLLRHRFAVPAKAEESLRQRAAVLENLRSGLRKIAAEHALPRTPGRGPEPPLSDSRGELLRRKLALVLPPDRVEVAMRWIRGEIKLADEEAQGLLEALPQGLLGPSGIDLWEADRLFAQTASLQGTERAVKQQRNYDFVLRRLIPWLRETLSRSFVKQQLAQALSLDATLGERLLDEWVLAAGTDSRGKAIAVFLDPAFVEDDAPLIAESYVEQQSKADVFPAQFRTLLRLQKVAAVLVRLKLDAHQAAYLFSDTAPPGWLDPRDLPLEPPTDPTTPQALYQSWLRLVDLCELRDRVGPAEPSLFDLFELAPQQAGTDGAAQPGPALTSVLSERMGWSHDDLKAVCIHLGYFQNFFRDFRDERPYLRLAQCFRIAKRIGVAISRPPTGGVRPNILDWLASENLPAVAQSTKLAARARHPDEEAWAKVARPLQDQIRERKRAALVDWLTTAWHWSTDDLYAHYLIDPEMSACMLTSRIKQAISSVQLFIQRIFLGIEEVQFTSDDAAQQWKWMKNYRVWEANRKIFLFPENWIEPELRDDKSPFFKELENELRQSELTAESVEKAYVNYLSKLEEVSNLEIMAQCYSDNGKKLHVFGRTRNTPYVHYYRCGERLEESRAWTSWEKVDADIQSEHLLPIAWKDNLRLYWPVFSQETENRSENDPPLQYWVIRLAWCDHNAGDWGTKQESRELIRPRVDSGLIEVRAWRQYYPPYLMPSFQDNAALFDFEFNEPKSPEGHDWELRVFSAGQVLTESTPEIRHSTCAVVGSFRLGHYRVNGSSSRVAGQPPCEKWETTGWVDDEYRFGIPLQGQALFGFGDPGYWNQGSPRELRLLWSRNNSTEADDWFKIIPSCDSSLREWSVDNAYNLFVCDNRRTLHVDLTGGLLDENLKRRFRMFYHPLTEEFLAAIGRDGIAGLFPAQQHSSREPSPLYRQAVARPIFSEEGPLTSTDFSPEPLSYAGPKPTILKPREDITFEDCEAYSQYNWELFFHIPLFVAARLSKEQRFEEATLWFHYIFDPLTPDPNDEYEWQRPWKMGRFFDNGDVRTGIEELMMLLTQKESPSSAESATGGGPYSYYNTTEENEKKRALRSRVINEIKRWRLDPFKPHLLARMRITPYMKTVVMKYLDNLIAWADQLFRRDTIESINEATQLYVLAAEILGPRPQTLPEREHYDESYTGIADRLDQFSNALEDEIPEGPARTPVRVVEGDTASAVVAGRGFEQGGGMGPWPGELTTYETEVQPGKPSVDQYRRMDPSETITRRDASLIQGTGGRWAQSELGTTSYLSQAQVGVSSSQTPFDTVNTIAAGHGVSPATQLVTDLGPPPLNLPPPGLFFCIPQNDTLVAYWDKVADRLFKIRHCMNIEGRIRELPLFEPPIEPGLLVKAAAAGVDFSTVLNDLGAPAPHYRFTVLAQKASELCQEVKSLGGALLAALEKLDAERLARLRSEREISLLEMVTLVRKQQILEGKETIKSIQQAKILAETRKQHFENVSGWLSEEQSYLDKQEESLTFQLRSQMAGIQGAAASAVPDVTTSVAGMCSGAHADIGGGKKLALIANIVSGYLGMMATIAAHEGTSASYRGQLIRAQQDRDLNISLASNEIKQIDQQIVAAEIRLKIAEQELANHEKQIENAKAVDEYMRTKFTNQDLYDWMVGQISTVYFQSYQLAYDMAKRAERAYRFELGIEDTDFIHFGYWDGLRKGLIAGEALSFDLKRMETAYLDNNRRDYEITRHVSLRLHDPLSLMTLKETGQCEFRVPEELFDADYPGHYFRRIKSVGLSIPCVVGPYTSVNCTLTLLSSRIRTQADSGGSGPVGYREQADGADRRFRNDYAAIESIATSHGKNDSGLFELNFRDERFLPFEGAGAISHWRIELPKETNAFDLDTVSDLVLTLRYTAREGGTVLRESALASRRALLEDVVSMDPPPRRLFSIRHDFPDQWSHLMGKAGGGERQLELQLTADHFSFLFRGYAIQLEHAVVYAKLASAESNPPDVTFQEKEESLDLQRPWPGESPTVYSATLELGGSISIPITLVFNAADETELGGLQDLFLLVTYRVTE